jgi:hypothetical protein
MPAITKTEAVKRYRQALDAESTTNDVVASRERLAQAFGDILEAYVKDRDVKVPGTGLTAGAATVTGVASGKIQ